jgi:hypothetical protein
VLVQIGVADVALQLRGRALRVLALAKIRRGG